MIVARPKVRFLFVDECYEEGNVRIVGPSGTDVNLNDHEGALQICVPIFINAFSWQHITTNGWTDPAARIACRQLGLSYSCK